MAVYKRSYSAYEGAVTSGPARILVLARYALAEAWSSKITIGLFILCWLPSLATLFGIYVANNPLAAALINGRGAGRLFSIDASFFLKVLQLQSWLALVLSSWIAPRLISFDLADNALPILLSHPISRVGYLGGKFIALFSSLSCVTWIPCLLLFCYQGYSSAQPWVGENLRIAEGMLSGAIIWITFLSLLGLALSSWVKWRVVATGIIFATVFIPAGIGAIVSTVLRTKWGLLLNLPFMMSKLWYTLLGVPDLDLRPADMDIPIAAIVVMLSLACLVCLAMLNARIRAREVVRG